jgi:hypothetical protein
MYNACRKQSWKDKTVLLRPAEKCLEETGQTCKLWLWQSSVIINKCSHVAWNSDIWSYDISVLFWYFPPPRPPEQKLSSLTHLTIYSTMRYSWQPKVLTYFYEILRLFPPLRCHKNWHLERDQKLSLYYFGAHWNILPHSVHIGIYFIKNWL